MPLGNACQMSQAREQCQSLLIFFFLTDETVNLSIIVLTVSDIHLVLCLKR